MSGHMDYDVPMFPVPPKYRPPKRERTWPQWRHYTGKPTSCDDCIRAIAAGELRWAPTPAAYVRADAAGRSYHCVRHQQDRRLAEEQP